MQVREPLDWREACAYASKMLRTVLFGIFTASTSFVWPGPNPVIIPSEMQSPGTLRAETADFTIRRKLVIFFEKLAADGESPGTSELPLLVVLRDTMGDNDPDNNHVRQVWVFPYTAPSPAQRIAVEVPFSYHRSGLDSGSSANLQTEGRGALVTGSQLYET